jgi:hypothetical protein
MDRVRTRISSERTRNGAKVDGRPTIERRLPAAGDAYVLTKESGGTRIFLSTEQGCREMPCTGSAVEPRGAASVAGTWQSMGVHGAVVSRVGSHNDVDDVVPQTGSTRRQERSSAESDRRDKQMSSLRPPQSESAFFGLANLARRCPHRYLAPILERVTQSGLRLGGELLTAAVVVSVCA